VVASSFSGNNFDRQNEHNFFVTRALVEKQRLPQDKAISGYHFSSLVSAQSQKIISLYPSTMLRSYNFLMVSIVLMTVAWRWASTAVDDQGSIRSTSYNYLRLPDGQCNNCSTYKCTNHKANLGGAEWCIMRFSEAIRHCNGDPNCGGYTMTTADWFHTKYNDTADQSVHLFKATEKPIVCPSSDWSSYEKQNETRRSPITYGRSTCDTRFVRGNHSNIKNTFLFVA
jgi:hypothetical protein